MKTLRIATRKSPMALWQAEHVKALIEQHVPNLRCELLPLVTTGDKFLSDTLAAQGGKGTFVKELEHALLNHEADIAVHSMKDVPANLPESLIISTYLTRDDPRDALVSNRYSSLASLPNGAKVGTASLRRRALLKHFRPDLQIEVIRGNVNTRLSKLDQDQYDALILAASGLKRIGFETRISQYLETNEFIPAITQGILGIECREDDLPIHALLAPLNDAITEKAALAERAFNRKLGGACHIPVAGFATIENQYLKITGLVADVEGKQFIQNNDEGLAVDAEKIGIRLAEKLLAQGAGEILSKF